MTRKGACASGERCKRLTKRGSQALNEGGVDDANDPRVKQAESDQIVEAMQAKNIPVTYVLYPDEGHGFARPENRMSFFGIAEAFLATNLEGEFEPLGDALDASTAEILAGADAVPGLAS